MLFKAGRWGRERGGLFPSCQTIACALFVEFALTFLTSSFGLSINPRVFSWWVSPLVRLVVNCAVHLGTNCPPLRPPLVLFFSFVSHVNLSELEKSVKKFCDVPVKGMWSCNGKGDESSGSLSGHLNYSSSLKFNCALCNFMFRLLVAAESWSSCVLAEAGQRKVVVAKAFFFLLCDIHCYYSICK